jgi:predicted nucleic acid-binding protein
VFVDTNVLVQARFAPAPFHTQARQALTARIGRAGQLRLSRQVMREYLAVVTRPQTWTRPLPMADALADLDRLVRQYHVLEDGPLVMQELIRLCRAVPLGGRQVHDANIVATMLAYGETQLLTFNEADSARFAPAITVVSP